MNYLVLLKRLLISLPNQEEDRVSGLYENLGHDHEVGQIVVNRKGSN